MEISGVSVIIVRITCFTAIQRYFTFDKYALIYQQIIDMILKPNTAEEAIWACQFIKARFSLARPHYTLSK